MNKFLEKLKENRNAIIVLVLIVIAIWVYKRSGTEIEPLINVLDQPGDSQLIGQELVAELDRLKSLNLINVNFFENPDFQSLEDITVEVTPQPIGRTDPFVPSSISN